MFETLAIMGGPKTISQSFRRYNSMGSEEIEAAHRVLESGVLSQFLGCWHPDFYGGPEVQAFERECEIFFGVRHAITLNSWTSGLIAAIGAIGIEPGDEVIVSPWTMCATATAILHWNAIPVFADIETDTFCIDPIAVEQQITPYTKAIMAVDIFGGPCNADALMTLAEEHKLSVITDTAQSPAALDRGRYAGTITHVGGFSLNYHKHIHTGEGGIIVTNNDLIAQRIQLIRNHAEAVVGDMGFSDLRNMLGYNFRLGEIEAAIGRCQLKKLTRLVATRQHVAERLTVGLKDLPGLQLPVIRSGCTHVYYAYPIVLDTENLKIDRAQIVAALEAEGLECVGEGYTCLHLLPLYQKKIAYGSKGFPWTSNICHREVSYDKGICPVAEKLHEESLITISICSYELGDEEIDLIIKVFRKVWSGLHLI